MGKNSAIIKLRNAYVSLYVFIPIHFHTPNTYLLFIPKH